MMQGAEISGDGTQSKNELKGIQPMAQLHTMYSLVNQMKQQSIEINNLQKMVARMR